MTEKQKDRILSLRKSGKSYAVIAESLGLSKDAVKSFCRRNTVSSSPSNTMIPVVYSNTAAVCRNCGAPIIQPEHVRKKCFCSADCRKAWWKENPSPQSLSNKNQRTCECCGTIFAVYGKTKRRYCSHSCYITARFRKGDACE
mgnify:CR=1 FL=1